MIECLMFNIEYWCWDSEFILNSGKVCKTLIHEIFPWIWTMCCDNLLHAIETYRQICSLTNQNSPQNIDHFCVLLFASIFSFIKSCIKMDNSTLNKPVFTVHYFNLDRFVFVKFEQFFPSNFCSKLFRMDMLALKRDQKW